MWTASLVVARVRCMHIVICEKDTDLEGTFHHFASQNMQYHVVCHVFMVLFPQIIRFAMCMSQTMRKILSYYQPKTPTLVCFLVQVVVQN